MSCSALTKFVTLVEIFQIDPSEALNARVFFLQHLVTTFGVMRDDLWVNSPLGIEYWFAWPRDLDLNLQCLLGEDRCSFQTSVLAAIRLHVSVTRFVFDYYNYLWHVASHVVFGFGEVVTLVACWQIDPSEALDA